MAPLLRNALPEDALRHARPQIQDLSTESIADLAVRARELGGVIPLWYGEGDMMTPAFMRDAAKAAFDEGMTFYIPDMRGHPPLNEALSEYQTQLHGRPIAPERTTVTPSGMQALYMATGAARRCRHQCRLRRAAMAEHPQRHPSDRRRAAPRCARFRHRLAARSRQAVRALRCPHPRHFPARRRPTRPAGSAARDEFEALLDFSRAPDLDHLGRGL